MSPRTLTSKTEQGNATHFIECNNEAVFKIVPADVCKTMRDAVTILGKRASIWVQKNQNDTDIEIRFVTLSNSLVSGEHWTAHRFVCVPADPERDTDEWEMMTDFFKMMYREASWSGVGEDDFTDYLRSEGLV